MNENIEKIGLISMSAKPYHMGHSKLIYQASLENDIVNVFVSLSDRSRKGEITIQGKKMEKIWNEIIIPTLPKNVNVIFSEIPIRSIYEYLGNISEEGRLDKAFSIYGDPRDLTISFPINSIEKYAKNLFINDLIRLCPIERNETNEISGMKMRQYIEKNDKESFLSNLPKTIDGEKIWNILKPDSGISEIKHLLKKFIKISLI